MQIDDALLDKLQKLGMIEIAQDKKEEVKNQLSEILRFVENLKNVKTDEESHALNLKTPLREDRVIDSQIRHDVLAHAPKTQDGFFVVPKIIE